MRRKKNYPSDSGVHVVFCSWISLFLKIDDKSLGIKLITLNFMIGFKTRDEK